MKALLQRYESLKQEKDQVVAVAQKDSQKAQEIKLELETQIQECERQRQLIDVLEQSKRASPRGMSDTESLQILDVLIGKQDASKFDEQIVQQMQSRLDSLKATYRDEYEM